jgi:hypothetical protein
MASPMLSLGRIIAERTQTVNARSDRHRCSA